MTFPTIQPRGDRLRSATLPSNRLSALCTRPTSPASLSVVVQPGFAFVAGIRKDVLTDTALLLVVPGSQTYRATIVMAASGLDVHYGTPGPGFPAAAQVPDEVILAFVKLTAGQITIVEADIEVALLAQSSPATLSAATINADTLDGLDSTDFARTTGSVAQAITGTKTFSAAPLLSTISANQVMFGGAAGLVSGAAGLTWNGSTLAATSLTTPSLTPGRVTYATTGGLLADNAGMTVPSPGALTLTSGLTAASLTDTGLTSGRVPYVSTGGLLVDNAGMTVPSAGSLTITGTMTAANFVGPLTLSGFTPGSVLFAGPGGTVSQDPSNLFWDDSLNRLGVDVASPTESVDINGNVKAIRLISTQVTGTAPLTVASTTVVTNLNADMVDGIHSSGIVQSLIAGTGIGVSGTTAVTVSNTGVLTVAAGTGISSTGGQNPSIANTGVLSVTASSGCASSGGQNPNITNTGVTSIVAGTNISISGSTGAVTINVTGGGDAGTLDGLDSTDFVRSTGSTTQTVTGSKTFSTAPTLSSISATAILFAGTGGLVSGNSAAFAWDNTNKVQTIGVNSGASATERKVLNFAPGGYASPGAYLTDSNGDKIVLYASSLGAYDARMGIGTAADLWFKSLGSAGGGIIQFYAGGPSAVASLTLSGSAMTTTKQITSTLSQGINSVTRVVDALASDGDVIKFGTGRGGMFVRSNGDAPNEGTYLTLVTDVTQTGASAGSVETFTNTNATVRGQIYRLTPAGHFWYVQPNTLLGAYTPTQIMSLDTGGNLVVLGSVTAASFSGTASNANTLDGLDSTDFVRSTGSVTQTITGAKTFGAQIASTVTTGTSPLSVASTTVNTNLNADMVDGLHSSSLVQSVTSGGTGISIGGTSTAPTVSNTGVTSIVAGTNISISGATGAVTINASISGGDATTLDGIDSTQFARKDASNTFSAGVTNLFQGFVTIDGFGDATRQLRFRNGFDVTASGGTGLAAVDHNGDTNRDGLGVFGYDGVSIWTWNGAAQTKRATFNMSGQLDMAVTTGTAPFLIASTTVNTNLNADMVDGLHSSGIVQSVTSGGTGISIGGTSTAPTVSNTGVTSLTLTTTGTSGAATLSPGTTGALTLNVPQYSNSGGDAATLDGLDSTDFVRSTGTVTQTVTGLKTFSSALTAASVTASSLTTGRVPVISTAGLLIDNAGFLFNTGTQQLSVGGDVSGSRHISTILTGTSPLSVTSTTVNTNLNADMVDGLHSSSLVQSVTSGGAGISIGGTPTAPTVNNTGVLSVTASSGCASSGGQNPNITNTGVTSIVAGTNITISGATGAVTINSTAGGSGTVTSITPSGGLTSNAAHGKTAITTTGTLTVETNQNLVTAGADSTMIVGADANNSGGISVRTALISAGRPYGLQTVGDGGISNGGLAVKVDGTTITINGSGALAASVGAGTVLGRGSQLLSGFSAISGAVYGITFNPGLSSAPTVVMVTSKPANATDSVFVSYVVAGYTASSITIYVNSPTAPGSMNAATAVDWVAIS